MAQSVCVIIWIKHVSIIDFDGEDDDEDEKKVFSLWDHLQCYNDDWFYTFY